MGVCRRGWRTAWCCCVSCVPEGIREGYTILKDYVQPGRRRRQPVATVRFETDPGEQAQVDWGSMSYCSG